MNKKFLISIDTEGDNLWNWSIGKEITTENSLYIPPFQSLCEEYQFKPIYLTNYEMANDTRFVEFAKEKQNLGKCEIGMHLHAWNTPPLDKEHPTRKDCKPGAPYLIEYSVNLMEDKIKTMTHILTAQFGVNPISHRAGRWATNSLYFDLLHKYGYKIDCSVTPGINWKNSPGQSPNSKGSNYKNHQNLPYFINNTDLEEYPVTIFTNHKFIKPDKWNIKSVTKSLVHSLKGNILWLRPTGNNLNECLFVLNESVHLNNYPYVMFMLHSSELMPGGSPTFKNSKSIKILYTHLKIIFEQATKLGLSGTTFREIISQNI